MTTPTRCCAPANPPGQMIRAGGVSIGSTQPTRALTCSRINRSGERGAVHTMRTLSAGPVQPPGSVRVANPDRSVSPRAGYVAHRTHLRVACDADRRAFGEQVSPPLRTPPPRALR